MKHIYNIESGIELENDAHVLMLPVYLLVSFFFFSNRSTVMTVCHWTLPISKYQSWHRFHYVFRRFFQYIFRFCAYLFILRDKRTRIISSNDSNYRKLLSSCSTQNYQINRDPKKNSPLLQFARMFHFSFVHRSSYRDVRDHVHN